ncbi:MAG: ATP-binding protein [Oligoflexales bacterium]
MGQDKNETYQGTISEYLSSQFKRLALVTTVLLGCLCIFVMVASVKFSTDRYVRHVCSKMLGSSRTLVQTSQLEAHQAYFKEIAANLDKRFDIRELHVINTRPQRSLTHYSLGQCSVEWQSDLQVALYLPSHWEGAKIYVKGFIAPKFFRSDLMAFITFVCLLLVACYYIGTRKIIKGVQCKISDPLHDVWNSLSSGNEPKKPENLEIRELDELWTSLTDYKKLVLLRNRMLLAKEYYHEVKAPTFYQYNQLRKLSLISDPQQKNELISDTLDQAQLLIEQMGKALKKIATDDYAKFPRRVNLEKIFGPREANIEVTEDPFVIGDKTLLKTLIQNLYANAVEACGEKNRIKIKIHQESEIVYLSLKNPVLESTAIDTERIFESGFTSKINGTGLGLSLCKHIVEIHKGTIKAKHCQNDHYFEMLVGLPAAKGTVHAPKQQDAIS